MKLGNMDAPSTIEFLEGIVSRSQSRTKLIERLEKGIGQKMDWPKTETEIVQIKKNLVRQIKDNSVNVSMTGNELIYCLQAIRCMNMTDIRRKSKYIKQLLRTWFNMHYSSASGATADNLRRAICWIDEALNM
jgi:hypothetical protein